MGCEGPVPAVQAAKAGWGTTSLPAALDTACRDGLCALLWWQPQMVAKWLVPLPINQSICVGGCALMQAQGRKVEFHSLPNVGSEVSF